MPVAMTRNGDSLVMDLSNCRGSEFQDALLKIKDLPGRRYDPEHKLWSVPAEPLLAERILHSIEPAVSDDLRDWIRGARIQQAQDLTTPLPDDADLLIPWARERAPWQPEFIEIGGDKEPFLGLMQHQRPVIDLAAEKSKLLICDDMGLGKTGSAISAVREWELRHGADPAPKLVICPNSVKGSWQREIKLWLGKDEPFAVIEGSNAEARHKQLEAAIAKNAWVIVNWEQIRAKKVTVKKKRRNGTESITQVEQMKEPLFEETPWRAVIADEIHRAKSRKSQQTRGLWRVRADDGVMLGLSGTPLMNSPDELWALLAWLWPNDYHDRGASYSPGARAYWSFYEQYVDYYEGHYGKIITGVRNPDALRFELKERLVRRTKEQAGLDLPGKRRIPVPITLNPKQRKLYEQAETEMWLEVEKAAKEGDKGAIQFAQSALSGDTKSMYRVPNGAARTVRLRQILETPALLDGEDDSAVLDACVERILDSQPKQWIVFTEFVETTNILAERLRKHGLRAEVYNGRVNSDDRKRLEEEFQDGRIHALIGTIKAMREGITLTAGDTQFWVSRDWVPDNNEQGEDRQNRIGQRNKVLVYIAQPEDTVATSKVEPKNALKERIVRAVIPKDHIEVEGKT